MVLAKGHYLNLLQNELQTILHIYTLKSATLVQGYKLLKYFVPVSDKYLLKGV